MKPTKNMPLSRVSNTRLPNKDASNWKHTKNMFETLQRRSSSTSFQPPPELVGGVILTSPLPMKPHCPQVAPALRDFLQSLLCLRRSLAFSLLAEPRIRAPHVAIDVVPGLSLRFPIANLVEEQEFDDALQTKFLATSLSMARVPQAS